MSARAPAKKRERQMSGRGGSKGGAGKPPPELMDPAVTAVRDQLQENAMFFVGNVATYVQKYQQKLVETQQLMSKLLPPPPDFAKLGYPALPPATILQDPEAAAAASASVLPAFAKAAAAAEDESTAAGEQPAEVGEDGEEVLSPTDAARVDVLQTDDPNAIEVVFPDNEPLRLMLSQLKREAYSLLTIFEGINDWIQLSAPNKLSAAGATEDGDEDGAAVGAEVMDAVAEQAQSLIETVRSCYDFEAKYLSDRVDLEMELLEAPQLASIALKLEIQDAEAWDEMERAWRSMVRACLILYTVLSRNMQRLLDPAGPRSDAAAFIYQ